MSYHPEHCDCFNCVIGRCFSDPSCEGHSEQGYVDMVDELRERGILLGECGSDGLPIEYEFPPAVHELVVDAQSHGLDVDLAKLTERLDHAIFAESVLYEEGLDEPLDEHEHDIVVAMIKDCVRSAA